MHWTEPTSTDNARASVQEIREKFIYSGHVDVIVSIGSGESAVEHVSAEAIHLKALVR